MRTLVSTLRAQCPFPGILSSLTQLSDADSANHTHQLSAERLIRSDNLGQQHPYFYMSYKY
jgi:hypothetical protein